MLLFRDEGHVRRWCEAREMTPGATITPEQAWRLAQGWYRVHKADPDWRRLTLDEAETLLASIGLTGPFWSLRG